MKEKGKEIILNMDNNASLGISNEIKNAFYWKSSSNYFESKSLENQNMLNYYKCKSNYFEDLSQYWRSNFLNSSASNENLIKENNQFFSENQSLMGENRNLKNIIKTLEEKVNKLEQNLLIMEQLFIPSTNDILV